MPPFLDHVPPEQERHLVRHEHPRALVRAVAVDGVLSLPVDWRGSFRHAKDRGAIAMPRPGAAPWGRPFFLRFSFRLRSLSFLLLASCLHPDSWPFRFDPRDDTTLQLSPARHHGDSV